MSSHNVNHKMFFKEDSFGGSRFISSSASCHKAVSDRQNITIELGLISFIAQVKIGIVDLEHYFSIKSAIK